MTNLSETPASHFWIRSSCWWPLPYNCAELHKVEMETSHLRLRFQWLAFWRDVANVHTQTEWTFQWTNWFTCFLILINNEQKIQIAQILLPANTVQIETSQNNNNRAYELLSLRLFSLTFSDLYVGLNHMMKFPMKTFLLQSVKCEIWIEIIPREHSNQFEAMDWFDFHELNVVLFVWIDKM